MTLNELQRVGCILHLRVNGLLCVSSLASPRALQFTSTTPEEGGRHDA